MNKKDNTQIVPKTDVSFLDFKQMWQLFVSKWRWFVVSVLTCLFIAGIYLWFTPSTVTVSSKMEIIDKSKKNSGMSAGLAMLSSLPMGVGGSLSSAMGGGGTVDSEKEIILSKTLVGNVVKDLNLFIEYRHSKWGKKILLYQNNPVEVTLDDAHVAWLDNELPLFYHQINLTITKDNNGYHIEPTLVEGKEEIDLPSQTFSKLPATIKTESGLLTFKENKLSERFAKPFEDGYTLDVTITPPTIAASVLIGRTSFEAPNKKVTNMANITVTDENVVRAIDCVNHLVSAYNQRANDDKNEEALKTDEFVNARLAKIDVELGSSDAAWENSKKNFQITEPEMDAQEALTKKSEYEAELVSIGTELQLHDYLSDYINDPANIYEIIPSGLANGASSASDGAKNSSSAGGSASLISRHNTLVNERKDLLKSVSEMSPQILRLNESIKELHPTLKLAMKRDRQQLVMKKNVVEREFSRYSGRIGTAPQMERVLTEIGRQREIKQGVYLLMLQKREETAMELANVSDKGRLIDPPAVVPASNKPDKKLVFIVSAFFGFVLPMVILYLQHINKTRVDTRRELESVTNLSVLAEIDKENMDEAIRTLRTNLLLNLNDGQKTILVASANDGDGKSFIAKKLEESLIAINKNVVLINGDYRSQVLPKGQHAADVLAGADFNTQIADVKSSNDYVIIDSPAIAKYTDAYLLATFADSTLYVVKAGKTDKSAIVSLTSDDKLPNPLLVFNK